MKKVLKFAGIISAALALVGFVLLMVTPVATAVSGWTGTKYYYGGLNAIFASGNYTLVNGSSSLTQAFDGKLGWSALLAWIFVLIALIILLLGIILPLLKVKALDKFAGILNLVAVCLLIVAGIFAFISKAVFISANDGKPADFAIGAGWVIGGILLIAGGVMAILPAAVDFIGKKK